MKILLTRSSEENQAIINSLPNGPELFLSAPMLSYSSLAINWLALAKWRNIIITSKIAAGLVARHFHYHAQVWVVGEESAKLLQTNPLLQIVHIANNVAELEPFIPDDSIYFSGDIITTPLKKARRYVVYKVHYTNNLEANIVKALNGFEICGIMVYSTNSALNLISLLKTTQLIGVIADISIITISQKVGNLWQEYCQNIQVASTPCAKEMLLMAIELIKKQT